MPASLRLLLLGLAAPCLIGSIGPRTNLEERFLAAHNRERATVGVPRLEWDEELAAGAREWADHLSRTARFEHSPDDPGKAHQGENLWGGTPGAFLPESMVQLWIDEKQHFKPGVFPAISRTQRVEDVSHYTQLIWRRTARVGCALSHLGREEVLVCRYSSAGNVVGERVF